MARSVSTFSMQQIWDCAAVSVGGTCASGVHPDDLIDAVGHGMQSTLTLVDGACDSLVASSGEPNASACSARAGKCGSARLLGGVSRYTLAPYYSSVAYSSLLASRAMMSEIIENGPVVSVLTFYNPSDFAAFGALRSRVYAPSGNVSGPGWVLRHCLVVHGWGIDHVTGHQFWWVQNSYGSGWGDGGFGRVLRGQDLLEGGWRGLFLRPTASTNNASLWPDYYYGSLVLRFAPSAHASPLLPDNDIIILTFLCSIFLACLLVYFCAGKRGVCPARVSA
jgi:hypothetical protein